MADSTALTLGPLSVLDRIPGMRQLLMLVALAVSISIGVTAAFWAREPNYSMLYSNISDRDAGEIVNVLATSEIPYQLDRKSGAVLVPGNRIHDARLKLAGQGLPRGTGFGLEIIEGDTGFSTSQFMENARYHHALETELSRTIANLRPVQNARVHLALPKNTVFLRDKREPSASVLVHLFPGRKLAESQVTSIVHLVASSIPEMESGAVTVVDQHGRLLTSPDDSSDIALSARQFEYTRRLEESYVERIVNLLTPMLGPGRVRATVSADLDFTVREETREAFDPQNSVVRSEQLSEDRRMGAGAAEGVPGALSNQPPESGTEVAAAQTAGDTAEEATAGTPLNESTRSTRNFEIDRTLSRTVQPVGLIQRLSVAVIVDDREFVGDDGEVTREPLSTTEIEEVTRLVREAVGFNADRGDSISISNVSFVVEEAPPPLEEPGFLSSPFVRDAIRQGLWALLLIALGLGIIRPIIRSLSKGLTGESAAVPVAGYAPISGGAAPAGAPLAAGTAAAPPVEQRAPLTFEDKINVARQHADRNPERVAQIVRGWVQSDD
ncbi:MAG: flagellar basal-body MS-ring/collar protein FliF [Gammaproteobacteria bacterium]|nr:flagellar basal-body MS-ring/collar protein FliF [Gammaproteobacteria bacterium]